MQTTTFDFPVKIFDHDLKQNQQNKPIWEGSFKELSKSKYYTHDFQKLYLQNKTLLMVMH